MKGIKLIKNTVDQESVPTKMEMEVLHLLWDKGPATVRVVHDQLNQRKQAVIYTSTLKLMQVMKEKGFLKRDESQMKHIYSAAVEEYQVKGNILSRLIDTIFNGSPTKLITALLGNDKTSPEELAQIKELISHVDLNKKQNG
jgi:BlaI family penicillinase repressor